MVSFRPPSVHKEGHVTIRDGFGMPLICLSKMEECCSRADGSETKAENRPPSLSMIQLQDQDFLVKWSCGQSYVPDSDGISSF
jgi:hypothetical protein